MILAADGRGRGDAETRCAQSLVPTPAHCAPRTGILTRRPSALGDNPRPTGLQLYDSVRPRRKPHVIVRLLLLRHLEIGGGTQRREDRPQGITAYRNGSLKFFQQTRSTARTDTTM